MPGYRVLIVEDDMALRNIYDRVLTDLGWTVLQARDGAEALSVLQQTEPDLMFLDMRLPSVNGLEVIGYISDNAARFTLMHVVVASSSKEYEREVDRLPSAEFILKPILPNQIRNIAQRLMKPEHE